MTQKTLGLFDGVGGWNVHDEELGLPTDAVENDPAARATASDAGGHHVHDDVTTFKLRPGHGYAGLKGGPPCQTFSAAGHGHGRRDLDVVLRELHKLVTTGQPLDYAHFSDPRTGLVLEPMRVMLDAIDLGEPFRWLALEQVPQVLPVWKAYAGYLETLGYSVATGNLHAEQYGVPQTRKRAVLIASLDRSVTLPTPTHSKYHPHAPEKLDADVLPWVSWGAALGVQDSALRSNYGTGGDPAARGVRTADQPAATVTSKIDRFKFAGTAALLVYRVSVVHAAILQSFPADYPWQGTKSQQYQQVGNAIPPLLARAVLRQVI